MSNIIPSVSQKMSTREIAKLTGKEHKNVKRDCEVMFSELNLDALKFEHIYFDSMNRKQIEYCLPKKGVLTLVSGYSISLRAKIIDRWEELENQVAKPQLPDFTNPSAAARAWADEVDAKLLAQQQLAIAAPKATALDRIADANGTMGVREAAKVLKINQKTLVGYLLSHKVLYRDQYKKLQTYQYSIDRGLTTSIVSAPKETDRGDIVFSSPKLTQKLITRIATWIENGMPEKECRK